MEPDLSTLNTEIDEVMGKIRSLSEQIAAVHDRLTILQEKITSQIKSDPGYMRNEAYFEQVKTEIQVTQDYAKKTNELVELAKRYLELLKKIKALKE